MGTEIRIIYFVKKISSHNYVTTLMTVTCYIRDIFVLFLQGYCALQELLMKMAFTLAVAPPFVHPVMSLPATPTLFGNMASLRNLLSRAKWQTL